MKATFLKGMRAVSRRWCLTAVALVGFAASAAGASLTITSPGNSKPVALLSAANKAFYELSLEQRQENLLTNKDQQPESNAKPVTLAWTGGTAPFAVTVKSGLTGKILYPYNAKSTAASSLDLYNLELGATYTCTVTDAAGATATHSFTTEDQPPRLMNPFALDGTCRNMRDLGGWPSYDGRKVRQNQIVRAMAFDDGSGTAAISTDKTSDCQQFLCNYLGIEYDFDLRPGSQTYVRGATWLDASVDYTYLWDVESPHAARVIQLANRNYRPAYVHCQAGKDRTGIVCYLTLLALGVSENDAKKDYETTGRGVLYEHFINAREWLRRSYPHADLRDSAVDYLLAYGMTESQLATFRNEMLEDTPAMAACSHAYETVKAVAATCTTEGQTAYQRCTKCGRMKTFPRKLSAHGHAYSATVTKTPTTSVAGTASLSCSRCGKTLAATLAPLGGEGGYSFVEWIHPTLTTDRSAGSYIAFPSTVKLDYSDTVRTRVWVGTSSSGRPAHVFSCNPDAYGLVDSCGKLGWVGTYKTKTIQFSTKYWAPYQWVCGSAWDVETRLNASGKFEISFQSIDKEPPTGWEDHARASKSDMAAGDAGPLTLFAKTTADGVVSRADVRMYAFTVTDSSGKVKYDFKPALRNSDGVAGLYETQTKAFYASSCAGAPFSWPGAEPDAEEGDIDEPCAHPEDQLTALAEVAATCTADGRTGGWHCAACGKDFGFATVTKLDHDLQVTETAATCTATGTRTEKCRRTGCTYEKTTTLDKLPHQYDSHGKCTECGATDPGFNPGGDEPEPLPVVGEDWGYELTLADGDVVRVYTNTSGTVEWTVPANVSEITYLVVGGGGGGGAAYGNYVGGGGGGGFAVTGTVAVLANAKLTIRVGAGGAGGAAGDQGQPGVASSLVGAFSVTAAGGGFGGGKQGADKGNGGAGGCGGGAAIGGAGGAGDPGGQGANAIKGWGGSGGGATGDGGQRYGSGGAGLVSPITGGEVEYGRGGVGAGQLILRADLNSPQGVGFGGSGGSNNGGAGEDAGAAGCDGVVVIRYGVSSGPVHVHVEAEIPAVAPSCTNVGWTAGTKCADCGAVLVPPAEIPMLPHTYGEDGKCTGCGAERPAFHDAAYEYAQRDWSSAVVCWGDSLTRGAYSSQLSGTSAPTNYYPGLLTEKLVDNSYPCRLAARLEASGRPVFAIADDGCETARILAPTWLGELETPVALTLPATESLEPGTGCYCTNTVTGGRPPYCWLSATMVNNRDSNRYLGLSGTFVANGEPLARVRVGGTNKFLYQQLDGETSVEIPAGAKLETDVSKMFKGSINVFFAGCNDGRSRTGYIDLIDQAAAGVVGGRYLVISPHCYNKCYPGYSDDWHELTAQHSALFEAKFGEHHLDLLAELDAKGVATAIELGALPASASGRNWYEAGVLLYDDQLHFNDAGYAVVAKFVHDKLTALGYLSGVEPSPSAAKVGDTEYPSVAAAVEAAQPGQTVVLTAQPTATIVMKGGVEVDVGAFTGVTFALPQGVDWFDLPAAPTVPGGSAYALVLNDKAKPVIAGTTDAPGFAISNGKVTVRIANAKPGLYYSLEAKSDLLEGDWQPVSPFAQDVELSENLPADPTRFYRVKVSDRP